jgi:uncharacterized protein (DUF1697 family)
MADLRRELTARGAADARTYLQSGNAVLSWDGDPTGLVVEAVAALGVACEVVVRTAADLADVVARCPWPERAAQDPALLHVLFLDRAVDVRVRGAGPQEEVRADGREVWVWYGAGSGRSRLALDAPGAVVTARNWRTVTALAELAEGVGFEPTKSASP